MQAYRQATQSRYSSTAQRSVETAAYNNTNLAMCLGQHSGTDAADSRATDIEYTLDSKNPRFKKKKEYTQAGSNCLPILACCCPLAELAKVTKSMHFGSK